MADKFWGMGESNGQRETVGKAREVMKKEAIKEISVRDKGKWRVGKYE